MEVVEVKFSFSCDEFRTFRRNQVPRILRVMSFGVVLTYYM